MNIRIPANLHLVEKVHAHPKWEHDCQRCVYLGHIETSHYGPSDLYFCGTGGMGESTVIARFGNLGPEYTSGMDFGFGNSEELTIARQRAQALGLLQFPVYKALLYAKPGTDSHEEMVAALAGTLEWRAYQAYLSNQADVISQVVVEMWKEWKAHVDREYYSTEKALHYMQDRMLKLLRTKLGVSDFASYETLYPAVIAMTAGLVPKAGGDTPANNG